MSKNAKSLDAPYHPLAYYPRVVGGRLELHACYQVYLQPPTATTIGNLPDMKKSELLRLACELNIPEYLNELLPS